MLVPVVSLDLGAETRILQLTQSVPAGLADEYRKNVCRRSAADYQELSLGREEGLTRIYAMTLTLTVLLAAF